MATPRERKLGRRAQRLGLILRRKPAPGSAEQRRLLQAVVRRYSWSGPYDLDDTSASPATPRSRARQLLGRRKRGLSLDEAERYLSELEGDE